MKKWLFRLGLTVSLLMASATIALAVGIGHTMSSGYNFFTDSIYQADVPVCCPYAFPSHSYKESTSLDYNSSASTATFSYADFDTGWVSSGHNAYYGPYSIVDNVNATSTQYLDLYCYNITSGIFRIWTGDTVGVSSSLPPFTRMYTYTDSCAANPSVADIVFNP